MTVTTVLCRRYMIPAFLLAAVCYFISLKSSIVESSDGEWVPHVAIAAAVNQSNAFSATLPLWLVEYAQWHQSVRQSKDWLRTHNLLIVVARDDQAGGLSDRFRSLPFMLLEAHCTKRVILIRWLRPFPLEEFLLPPQGGIDWRVPRELGSQDGAFYLPGINNDLIWHEGYQDGSNFTTIANRTDEYGRFPIVAVQPNVSSFFQGMELVYEKLHPSLAGQQISNMYLRLLFTPSPPVRQQLEETMRRFKLSPKEYIGVHLRSRYPDYVMRYQLTPIGWNETNNKRRVLNRYLFTDPMGQVADMAGIQATARVKETLKSLSRAAIDCAHRNLIPESGGSTKCTKTNTTPAPVIYFASDTNFAVQSALEEFNSDSQKRNHGPRVVGMVTSNERLHLNVDSEVRPAPKTLSPTDFYPTFIDFWILSQARCISAGQGGYALFSSVFGGSGSCVTFHSTHSIYALHHLPSGYVTIRNITFCKPQNGREFKHLTNAIDKRNRQEKKKKWSQPIPVWTMRK